VNERVRIMEDLIRCDVCFEPFTSSNGGGSGAVGGGGLAGSSVGRAPGRLPRVLDCGHSYCEGCLESIKNQSRSHSIALPCPGCRHPTTFPAGRAVSSLPTNFAITQLVDHLQEPKTKMGGQHGKVSMPGSSSHAHPLFVARASTIGRRAEDVVAAYLDDGYLDDGYGERRPHDVNADLPILREYLCDLRVQVSQVKEIIADIEAAQRKELERRRKVQEAEDLRLAMELWAREKLRQQQEEACRRAAQAAAAEMNLTARGKYCDYVLGRDAAANFPDDMKSVTCVAISGRGGFVAVYDNGHVTWGGSIEAEVLKILKRQHYKMIEYVALGSEGQYYIRKTNGKTFYHAGGEFEPDKPVEFIAFGSWDTYYTKYADGSSCWSGVVDATILRLFNEGSIKSAWLGADDYSYFVRKSTGKLSYRGVPPGTARYVSAGSVKQILGDDTYSFVRYS
jgi:RING-type zinc-finger